MLRLPPEGDDVSGEIVAANPRLSAWLLQH
jgi:hypothetical protein